MKCTYCSVSSYSHFTFRRRSLSSVLDEIDKAVTAGARFIDFEDENLSIQRDWFLELLSTLTKRYAGMNLELRAMNGLLPTTLDDSVVKAMTDAGFKELNLALCTTDRDQLKRFLRPDVRTAFEKTLGWAEQYQLKAVGYIIIGAPWQTPESSLDDLLYFADKKVLAGLSVYYPSPGSTDFDTYRQQGLLPASDILSRSTALPISHTTSRLEAITLLRLSRVLNYMKSISNPWKDLVPNESDETGKRLLSMFLKDGKIRGIDTKGEIYEQNISLPLTELFLKKLNQLRIKSLV